MTNYRIGAGHGLLIGATALLVPQPRSENRVQAAQRDYGADGGAQEAGLHIILEWNSLGTFTELTALIAQFSFGSSLTSLVTGNFPDRLGVYHLYNGIAVLPQSIRRRTFITDLRVVVKNLVQIP